MMDFIQNFHFLRPWFLLFLLIPFGLLLKKIKANQTSSWFEICDKHLLNFLIVNETGVKKVNLKKFIYIGLIFACISVAGPSWKKIEINSFSVENPNMFVLSLAQDMQLTDVTPSRLDRAKYMISDITDNISVQGQYGIIVYSEEPYIISPISEDINLIKSLLYQIVPDIVPDNGDRLDRAISLAIERFKSAGYSKGNIILLASDVGYRFDLAIEKTKEASALGYSINIIDTSYDGNDKLKLLADTTNGVYMRIFDTSIKPLTDKITQIDDKNIQKNKNLRSIYLDFGYYLVFIPLLCLLLFFRKGLLVLVLCYLPFNANAGFLLNDNQEGFSLFKQGKYEDALNKFKDENWQGVSLYMLEKYEDALNKFENVLSSDGFYNKGVTLVKLCKYEEALKAFEKSFVLNHQNKDAQYNIDILNKLFNEAKEKPELLNCENNQQQNSSDNSNNNNNKENENGKDNDNDDKNSNNDENINNGDKQEQSSQGDKDQEQHNKNNDQKHNNNSSESDNKTDNKQNEQSEKNQTDTNKDNNESKLDDTSNKSEKKDSSLDKDKTERQENKLSPSRDNDNVKDFRVISTKEGNKDEKYDEEAIALQRIYREIPEDIGGLLREFIKKEHLKDRYNNENL